MRVARREDDSREEWRRGKKRREERRGGERKEERRGEERLAVGLSCQMENQVG